MAEVSLVRVELEACALQSLHDHRDVCLVLLPRFAVDDDVVEVDLTERFETWRGVLRSADAVCEDAFDESLEDGGGVL